MGEYGGTGMDTSNECVSGTRGSHYLAYSGKRDFDLKARETGLRDTNTRVGSANTMVGNFTQERYGRI